MFKNRNKSNQKIISKKYFIKRFKTGIKIIVSCLLLFGVIIFNKKEDIKVAICTMGKNENLYVKEYISYYYKLGVDKIIIYDDNDMKSEKISDMVDFKYKEFIKIKEAKKLDIQNQSQAFTDCYEKYNRIYDWLIMIDMDEYLYIKNDTLKNYLLNPVFNKCDFIKIHWIVPTDNNQLYYENKPLFERFKGPYVYSVYVKSILRGDIPGLKYWVHSPYMSPERNTTCNNAGQIINYKKLNFEYINKIDITKAFFIHFKYKSTEEFIKKIKRGYSNWYAEDRRVAALKERVICYLKENKITLKKLEFLEKELNFDLSKYKRYANKTFVKTFYHNDNISSNNI